ncbi:MAG: F0F1 ATP synthase subunit B [Candidatus Faecousia sp.]|uniref:F0F1 ATP synthase subunit B n=1 Tax=Faecousia sp. TaxID=2952921 RepID=UPI002A8628B1|nr:F0F1 ATP synthase subunit B [Candidatus Faecousia sp.]
MKFLTGFESFVGVNFWTCLFTLVNLFILYKFMKKLLFKPVQNMIDSRQKEIDDLYADAGRSKAEAEALKTQYEGQLSEANAERERILKAAHQRALQQQETMLREAQEQAARTLKRADEQIELEKKQARNELKNEVSDMAVQIAGAVLARDVKPAEHEALIDSFIDGLGDSHD